MGTRSRSASGSAATALPDMPFLVAAGLGVLVGVPLFTLTARAGLGQAPVWVPVLGLALTLALAQESPQRRLGNGSLSSRPGLRVVVGLSCFALLIGGSGMTYLFPPAGVLVGAVHIDRSGAGVWRPAAALTAAYTVLLQVLVGLGVLPTELPLVVSHVSAAWALLLAVIAIVSFGRNAAAREQAAQDAAWAGRRLRALVDQSYDLTVVTDADSVAQAVYGAAHPLLGRSAESLLGTRFTDLVHADDRPLVSDLQQRLVLRPDDVHRVEVRVGRADGTYRWHEFTAQDLRSDPAVTGIVLHQRDVEERRAWQDGLARAADRDGLTGLLNRGALERRLFDRISRGAQGDEVAVLFCDMDHFKQINDAYGHRVGDHVLVEVARRLTASLGPDTELARIGGDEFVAVLAASVQPARAEAEAAAARLRTAMAQPLRVDDLTLGTGISVGVAVGSSSGRAGSRQAVTELVAGLLERADQHMYQDKRRQATGRTHG